MELANLNLFNLEHLLKVFRSPCKARLMSVATASPEQVYTQKQVSEVFGIENKVVRKLMDSGHIKQRHLYLPPVDPKTGTLSKESNGQLYKKFLHGINDIGYKACLQALTDANLTPEHVDNFVAVTSSGLASPGISALLAKKLGMRSNLHRSDIVGMGCNAGMSALYSASQWTNSHPKGVTLLLCCEVMSACYVKDETIRTGIVNSLFGDGAVAIVLGGKDVKLSRGTGSAPTVAPRLEILEFESHTIYDQIEAMKYDFDDESDRLSFFLSKDIPFVIGENMYVPVRKLLQKMRISRDQVAHWVLHTGGGAVIEGAKKSLGLSEFDVRHTRSVLRDYGNLSSGSFLVSLNRLHHEGRIKRDEIGVMVAMGPGSTIEACVVRWV